MVQRAAIHPDLRDSGKRVVGKYYIDEGCSPGQVGGLIKEYCHFEVTRSQLTRRIRRRNLQKSITRSELLYMAKVCQARASVHKSTAFAVRRRYYTEHGIRRKFKRSGLVQNDILAFDEDGQDLDDVKCLSPLEDTWSRSGAWDELMPHYVLPQAKTYWAAGSHLTIPHVDPQNPVPQTVAVQQNFRDDDDMLAHPEAAPTTGLQCHISANDRVHLAMVGRLSLMEVMQDFRPSSPRFSPRDERNGCHRLITGTSFHPSGSLYERRRSKKALTTQACQSEVAVQTGDTLSMSHLAKVQIADLHCHLTSAYGCLVESPDIQINTDVKNRMQIENILCHRRAG